MWVLRVVLILLGVAFVLGVYWYTRRHPPRKTVGEGRIEPSFDPVRAAVSDTDSPGTRTEPAAPPKKAEDAGAAARPAAPDEPGHVPATRVRASRTGGDEIFTLALRLPGEGVPATDVLRMLERLDFEPGEQQIYHRPGPDGMPLYSAANLFEPGVLHPLPEASTLRGLVFFFRAAPGPVASSRFDRMLGTVRECAERFGGRVEDSTHRPLTAARELELKLVAAGARSSV